MWSNEKKGKDSQKGTRIRGRVGVEGDEWLIMQYFNYIRADLSELLVQIRCVPGPFERKSDLETALELECDMFGKEGSSETSL